MYFLHSCPLLISGKKKLASMIAREKNSWSTARVQDKPWLSGFLLNHCALSCTAGQALGLALCAAQFFSQHSAFSASHCTGGLWISQHRDLFASNVSDYTKLAKTPPGIFLLFLIHIHHVCLVLFQCCWAFLWLVLRTFWLLRHLL